VPAVSRSHSIDWFTRTRARSRRLFDLLDENAYYARPISLRHPIVFYEGHLAAFTVNTLVKKALGLRGVDERLERLFARGIDPEDAAAAKDRAVGAWPARREVRAYVEEADRLVLDALESADVENAGVPAMRPFEAVHAAIEHEAMHQETLLYIWHRLPFARKKRPDGAAPLTGGDPPPAEAVRIPGGTVTLGADPERVIFGWDNEFPTRVANVPAFEIDRHNVTNASYLEFVASGAYEDPQWWSPAAWTWLSSGAHRHPLFWERGRRGEWLWRGMFELVPLPLSWPVYVSQAEAAAFARWRGRRLPTEAEYHRAAFGSPEGRDRPHPWGEAPADASRGNFDFARWDPVPAGSTPAGTSAWGVEDLTGNGWEWTSTIFEGFPGFAPMTSYPEYSADFFDGQHYVMKGASPATARELIRASFRNWFRPNYPYVYATFRCARSL
jgi:ergothioneine biosynthesis protein EgtB